MSDQVNDSQEPAAVGVCFRRSGKVYYFRPHGLQVEPGEFVLAETEKGTDIGQVVFVREQLEEGEAPPAESLVRKATRADVHRERRLQEKEQKAFEICARKIATHGLDMKLVEADYTLDGKQLTFSFTAENRVDFRQLVQDLAQTFHCRIELHQIGVRDEAKFLGGVGRCGRPLCCTTFLRGFESVGIRLAKDQGLSLNPENISGVCDRLMCCLSFEHDNYIELDKKLPPVGTSVMTPYGSGEVMNRLLLKQKLVVRIDEGKEVEVPASEVSLLQEEVSKPTKNN